MDLCPPNRGAAIVVIGIGLFSRAGAILTLLGLAAVVCGKVLARRLPAIPQEDLIGEGTPSARPVGKRTRVVGHALGFVVGSFCCWFLFSLMDERLLSGRSLSRRSSPASIAAGIGLIVSCRPGDLRTATFSTLVTLLVDTVMCTVGFYIEFWVYIFWPTGQSYG